MAKRDRSTPKDQQARIQVMKAEHGRYYVNARAGTGKTESLAKRVAYALQLEDNGARVYQPSDMLCITFTNGAEDEMRRRIKEILTKEGSGLEKEVNSVYIGNIHKFCLRFLKTIGRGLHPFTIIDEISLTSFADSESSLEYETSSGRHKTKRVTMDEVRKYAATMRQIQEKHPAKVRMKYFSRIPKAKKAVLKNLANQYLAYKKEHNYCDFDDILIDTYSRLSEKGARQKYPKMSAYKWIQVDEMQDLNPLQHGIISKLISDSDSTVCYYGDICQAIFSFLGTRGNILKDFPDFGKSGHMFIFTENFRSPEFLVRMFDRYITAYLRPSLGVNVDSRHSSHTRPLDRLHIFEYDTDSNERKNVAEAVKKILEYNEKNPGKARRRTAAILVRTGEEADLVSNVLLYQPYKPKQRKNARVGNASDDERGIPHLKVSGSDSLKRDAIRMLLSHFSVVNDEFSRVDWARILYHLHCASSYAQARAITSTLHSIGMLPSDFILREGSSYLREFYNAATKGSVVFCTEEDMLYAMRVSGGELQEGMFSGPTSKTGDCLDAFLKFVGDAALIGFESEGTISTLPSRLRKGAEPFENSRVWSLRKTSRLLSENESHEDSFTYLTSRLPACEKLTADAPEKFRRTVSLLIHHISVAESKLPLQDAYMANLGARYLAGKLKTVYGPVFLHSRVLLARQTMKDSDKVLADEFRWAYKALLKKRIIHNFNPQLIDRKNKDYADQIDAYNPTTNFNKNSFNRNWEKVINEEQKQTAVKTGYFFDYIEKSIFMDGSRKLVRNLLDEHLQEIKFIRESDLCQQPFVKEAIYVMTVHQAKGHEFSDVFILGASDKTYPFFGHKARWETDEDKRLFYVAMTRSSNRLTISYAKKFRGKYNGTASRTPYVDDIIDFFNVESGQKEKDNGAKGKK